MLQATTVILCFVNTSLPVARLPRFGFRHFPRFMDENDKANLIIFIAVAFVATGFIFTLAKAFADLPGRPCNKVAPMVVDALPIV
ncbi:hypothetical protein L596_027362 [Steinernema carpocapsae]|uniref:Uncharacterized protein n=1 Tax=Steinernema carpocapsae TaxID=34508 RepID=A0A4U5M451_STECR|nr:hypothetical protein L596_027362 [Steinernema carpocapsae]